MTSPYFEAHSPIPPLDERVTNVFERKIATPATGRTNVGGPDVRQGHRQASEDLENSPDVIRGLLAGATDAYQRSHTFQHQVVSGDRTQFGARIPHPSWTDEEAYVGSFAAGSSGDPGPVTDCTRTVREQTWNHAGFSPWQGLVRGERQNTHITRKIAPANGGRGVRNDAEVRDD